ncbi:MAG TPA: efflux transporter outer membrane subunit [Caulobacteraceae bacterium]|nr:efflux transporter outer membrane subunit [Caulobacteraceae bacterium]
MRRVLSLGLTMLLAGCTLAPRYERPAPPTPSAFPQGGPYQAAVASAAPLQDWKTAFSDPRLQRLIQTGLTQNRSLRQTVANVLAAHGQFEVQRSQLLPSLSANGSELQQHAPAALGGNLQPGRLYTANLAVSAYELDLFGRLRSQSEAAFQQYLASDEGRRAAQISLVAEIASAYLTLAADQQLVSVSRQTEQTAGQALSLIQSRFDAGIASDLDVSQAETVVQQARADAAGFAVAAAQAKDALDLLVGQTVEVADLPVSLDEVAPTIAATPVGLSSQVLLSRPDVLQAEHLLQAANAEIGAARAAFFPRISLTGQDGFESVSLSNLFQGANRSWSFNPAVTLPLFAGGKNLGNLRTSQAQRDAAVAAYENAVQSAFRDVADALASAGGTVEQLSAQEALVAAAGQTVKLASARYDRGADTYLNLLVAQRTLFAAQESLVKIKLANVSSRVTLYRALGGGAG